MDVKGFLLSNGTDREFLLSIQPSAHGPYDRLVVREKVDGYWVDLAGLSQGTWRERARAIEAVLGYLQDLRSMTPALPNPER
ncbi:hypothetical protein FBQ96_16215 [Nitrospirales bacterium NOB]|nr:MAG: hypothetical protein UZ03_NOB001001247 [Nitrospira sp. OLB3]MBV6468777.1 hypothetical protein [Nitrospirota bacterium]MCE7964110.1 hypothetical protein [Nitrospira sp. NTP2]MCK6493534.1 hypothetical protein [Nitrospira sp.]MDL1891086.1 hypothetical protein [Nitrospirales bacterium NOB]MEB2337040.1 hypothetical protein [Nitrospirales bacterium]